MGQNERGRGGGHMEKCALETLKYMFVIESGGERENRALRIKSYPLEWMFVCLRYVSAHFSRDSSDDALVLL